MSNRTLMDPADFAERLERSFSGEPPHAEVGSDLARGRRRLRRRRATTGLAGLGVAATVAVGAVAVPALQPAPPAAAPWASSGPVTDTELVRQCLEVNDRVTVGGRDHVVSRAELLQRMGAARLMTRADAGPTSVATVRAENGRAWLDCSVSRKEPALKVITLLYPSDVGFARTTVDGVRAYEPHDESDVRFSGTATSPVPRFAVDCDVEQPEETPEWFQEAAACPTYRLVWNDRRPPEVAHVQVTAPDGRELDADVQDGYVSLAHSAPMTPELRRQLAAGEVPRPRRIAFLDRDGDVLVEDRSPGHVPQDGTLSMANFPSLAWWRR